MAGVRISYPLLSVHPCDWQAVILVHFISGCVLEVVSEAPPGPVRAELDQVEPGRVWCGGVDSQVVVGDGLGAA